jgi:hypothetical protein
MKPSRPGFLYTALGLPATAVIFRVKAWGLFMRTDDSNLRRFTKPEIIRYDSNGFTINGVDTFLYGLECPYPPRNLA